MSQQGSVTAPAPQATLARMAKVTSIAEARDMALLALADPRLTTVADAGCKALLRRVLTGEQGMDSVNRVRTQARRLAAVTTSARRASALG